LHAQFGWKEGVELVACASRSQDKADAFAAEHDIARPTTVETLLADPQVDGLVVVAPAGMMHEVARDAAGAGLPLLLEKPVGMDTQETRAAVDAVCVPNMVAVNRRFYEVIRRGKQILEEAGGVRFIEVHMPEDLRAVADRYSGKPLENWQYGNSIHLLDLFRFFGGEIESVETNNTFGEYWDRSYSALLTFETGARGLYNAQWYAPGPWRVSVYADNVMVRFEPIEKASVVRGPGRQLSEILPEGADAAVKAGLTGQAEAFAHLVRTGTLADGASDLADYFKSVELVAALTEA